MSGDSFYQKWSLEKEEITRHYGGLDPDDVDELVDALKAAMHELTTLHGLYVYDGPAPTERWQLDIAGVTGQLEDALALVQAREANVSRREIDEA